MSGRALRGRKRSLSCFQYPKVSTFRVGLIIHRSLPELNNAQPLAGEYLLWNKLKSEILQSHWRRRIYGPLSIVLVDNANGFNEGSAIPTLMFPRNNSPFFRFNKATRCSTSSSSFSETAIQRCPIPEHRI
jgi:hypothetical protein